MMAKKRESHENAEVALAEGPALEILLHRLTDCPSDFIESCNPQSGRIDVAQMQLRAIVCDLLRKLRPDFQANEYAESIKAQSTNHAATVAVLAWLFGDTWFIARDEHFSLMQSCFISSRWVTLSELVHANQLVQDPDRREELVRVALSELRLRPANESPAQAIDRLTTLDSVERQRVLKATLAAEKRAREVREAMAKAKALESSSRYGE